MDYHGIVDDHDKVFVPFVSGMNAEVLKMITKAEWNTKSILWEVSRVSEMFGTLEGLKNPLPIRNDYQQVRMGPWMSVVRKHNCLLDIDGEVNSVDFTVGDDPHNRSVWAMTVSRPRETEYLGIVLHLLELDLGILTHFQPWFDEFELEPVYFKFTISILSPTGTVLHRLDNPSLVSLVTGGTWREDKFIRLDSLLNPALRLVINDVLRIRLDLSVFKNYSCTASFGDELLLYQAPTPHISETLGAAGEVMKSLWKNRTLADIDIHCGSEVFRAHQWILITASPVFRTMFSVDMIEKAEKKVVIKDLDPVVLNTLLEFVYTGQVSEDYGLDKMEDLFGLLNASEKYQLKALKQTCVRMLQNRIDVTNAGWIAIMVHYYNIKGGAAEVLYSFITRNISTLREDKEFAANCMQYPAAFARILLSDAAVELASFHSAESES